MIRSMTGFASAERQYEFGRLTWELRSVNHRYLDIALRLPEELRSLEPNGLINLAKSQILAGQRDAAQQTIDRLQQTEWPSRFDDPVRKAIVELNRMMQQQ